MSIVSAIHNGETVSSYPDDQPYPSELLLGIVNQHPVHVVVARDEKDYACYVITAYVPSLKLGMRISKRGNNHEMCYL